MPSNRTYTLGQALRLACQARTPAQPRNRYPTYSYSTQSDSSSSSDLKGLADEQDPHESARARLRPLVDSFDGKVDYAVAYGSGVIHQANRPTTNESAPLTDLIISVPSAKEFHRTNLSQNPSHYPFMARLVGSRGIAWLQENWGARVWYVTMVKIRGLEVKYGIIQTKSLIHDLRTWETLYISGRLQKPHLPLLPPPSSSSSSIKEEGGFEEALQTNLRQSLSLALILLPDKFTEYQLWEKIAGISYAGDPRMSVPGAENPEKVRNIVRGEGALEGFRAMYGNLLELAVHWEGEGEKGGERISWRGQGEDMMVQPSSSEYIAKLLLRLPPRLLHPVARHYRPTIVGSLVSPSVREQRQNETIKRSDVPSNPEFWVNVASQERIKEVVLNELRGIIRRPALTQSIKGLFTAGFTKSFWYSLAKFQKWLKGRKKDTK